MKMTGLLLTQNRRGKKTLFFLHDSRRVPRPSDYSSGTYTTTVVVLFSVQINFLGEVLSSEVVELQKKKNGAPLL